VKVKPCWWGDRNGYSVCMGLIPEESGYEPIEILRVHVATIDPIFFHSLQLLLIDWIERRNNEFVFRVVDDGSSGIETLDFPEKGRES
jgi:hypothetical protein